MSNPSVHPAAMCSPLEQRVAALEQELAMAQHRASDTEKRATIAEGEVAELARRLLAAKQKCFATEQQAEAQQQAAEEACGKLYGVEIERSFEIAAVKAHAAALEKEIQQEKELADETIAALTRQLEQTKDLLYTAEQNATDAEERLREMKHRAEAAISELASIHGRLTEMMKGTSGTEKPQPTILQMVAHLHHQLTEAAAAMASAEAGKAEADLETTLAETGEPQAPSASELDVKTQASSPTRNKEEAEQKDEDETVDATLDEQMACLRRHPRSLCFSCGHAVWCTTCDKSVR